LLETGKWQQEWPPFSRHFPFGAVYLNLRALSEKNVCYRPELKTLEDKIFAYECEQKCLNVYREWDNCILYKTTTARTPEPAVHQSKQ